VVFSVNSSYVNTIGLVINDTLEQLPILFFVFILSLVRIMHNNWQPEIFYLLKGSVKELNMFHNYETEKITRKASEAAEYTELFGSSARDRHAGRI